ncbi:MAG: hypothetical protein AMXMBFR25_00120 [Lysobacterales bacterium]|nr:hypothetical protein [Xanthomonadales bacterium]
MSDTSVLRKQDLWMPAVERVCATLVEEYWRAHPGLALCIGSGATGTIERPGRTRFDLFRDPCSGDCSGPLRARTPHLPIVDGALALVLLDRLALSASELHALLREVLRVLAEDGRVLLLDYNPWGWIGWRRRWGGERLALAGTPVARCLRHVGFEDIETVGALRLPPLPHAFLQHFPGIMKRGAGWPWPVSVQAVGARKRSSNVIAIPCARDRRRTLVAAPEGMRRAG